uniref:F-box domain-containing protein n=1 Tax=Onchocerca volvulus TaxID=6282 RepID=A0A8R1XM83_ONCVO
MMKYRLKRENVNVTNLPDEIIELICSYISPVKLCLSGWKRVSKDFSKMLQQVYMNIGVLNTIAGQDCKFFEQFCLFEAYENKVSSFQDILLFFFKVTIKPKKNIYDIIVKCHILYL